MYNEVYYNFEKVECPENKPCLYVIGSLNFITIFF